MIRQVDVEALKAGPELRPTYLTVMIGIELLKESFQSVELQASWQLAHNIPHPVRNIFHHIFQLLRVLKHLSMAASI